jgi:hypothetical protein
LRVFYFWFLRIHHAGLVIPSLGSSLWFSWFPLCRFLFFSFTNYSRTCIHPSSDPTQIIVFSVFCWFLFPLPPLFRLLLFSPVCPIAWLKPFFIHRKAFLCRWFSLHCSGSRMRVADEFQTRRSVTPITTSGGYHHREPNRRTERQRRYHHRRKIRFRCRLEATVYLRFLYEHCA